MASERPLSDDAGLLFGGGGLGATGEGSTGTGLSETTHKLYLLKIL